MPKGSTFCNDWLKLIFNATAIADIADNDATSPLTSLQVSAHTANPGAGGSQTTSECAYTGYARAAVVRTSGGWTVTSASVSPAAEVAWPASTSGPEVITHIAVGTAASGAGKILYCGTITPNITVNNGVTPIMGTGTTITEA